VIFIAALLHERDRRVLIAHPHIQRHFVCADGQRSIPQLAGQIKGLSQGLLLRQTKCVLLHLRLDARPHRACRPEEPIRRRRPLKTLMRALEVVVLDKKPHPALAVLEVGEHRPREQLLPQRLPEPLDLPAGLRVMRTALHVRDAVAL
jgi:hypothetical protein